MNTKLAADHLCKTYGSRTILHDLSFSVEEGTSMAITGPSGSGKSTLLNIIGLLDTPTGGAITLDGQPPAGYRRAPGDHAAPRQDQLPVPVIRTHQRHERP